MNAPENTVENLKDRHPWVAPWMIDVSPGLCVTVNNMLLNIEDVMYSKEPSLSYLWITEELASTKNIDLSDLYRRKLMVFAQAKDSIPARDSALEHIVNTAIAESQSVCISCGGLLEIKDLKSESQREEFPFLPEVPLTQWHQSYSTVVYVCMSCACQKWVDDRENDFFVGIIPCEDEFLDADKAHKTSLASKIQEAAQEAGNLSHQEGEDINEQDGEYDEEPEPLKQNQVVVFSESEVNKLEADYRDSIKDHATRAKGLVKKLRATSATKELMMIPDDWRNYCDDLEKKFPNFSEAVGFIRTQIALSFASDSVLRLPPFLLLGDPGIGKTEFSLTIASDFKTRLEIIDIASAQSGAGLSGTEAHWSTSQTGAIFNAVVFSDHANPIILLDELDKARNDEHYNTLAVLHQVLEPRQAKMYRDLSVPELTIDASHIVWIGTANKADLIEKPILDRFVCFNIEPPAKTQMPAIVTNQYQRFIDTHPSGRVFDVAMRDEVLTELCKHHPRKVRKMLNQAFGLAALNERAHITVDDIKASESDDKKQNGIGFGAEIN